MQLKKRINMIAKAGIFILPPEEYGSEQKVFLIA
jgi:hypothetical protein